MNTWARKPQNR